MERTSCHYTLGENGGKEKGEKEEKERKQKEKDTKKRKRMKEHKEKKNHQPPIHCPLYSLAYVRISFTIFQQRVIKFCHLSSSSFSFSWSFLYLDLGNLLIVSSISGFFFLPISEILSNFNKFLSMYEHKFITKHIFSCITW